MGFPLSPVKALAVNDWSTMASGRIISSSKEESYGFAD
jgi:hypothetical protein